MNILYIHGEREAWGGAGDRYQGPGTYGAVASRRGKLTNTRDRTEARLTRLFGEGQAFAWGDYWYVQAAQSYFIAPRRSLFGFGEWTASDAHTFEAAWREAQRHELEIEIVTYTETVRVFSNIPRIYHDAERRVLEAQRRLLELT